MDHDEHAADVHPRDEERELPEDDGVEDDDDFVDVTPLHHQSRTAVPPRRSGNMHGVNEAQRWADFGRFVAERREQLSLNRRATAKKAKLPESTLKALESGYQTAYGGVRVLPNLTADELQRLADALELEGGELRGRLGRAAPRLVSATGAPDSRSTALARRIARLDEVDRQLVELLVQRLSQRD